MANTKLKLNTNGNQEVKSTALMDNAGYIDRNLDKNDVNKESKGISSKISYVRKEQKVNPYREVILEDKELARNIINLIDSLFYRLQDTEEELKEIAKRRYYDTDIIRRDKNRIKCYKKLLLRQYATLGIVGDHIIKAMNEYRRNSSDYDLAELICVDVREVDRLREIYNHSEGNREPFFIFLLKNGVENSNKSGFAEGKPLTSAVNASLELSSK